jgi:hypothetical protein
MSANATKSPPFEPASFRDRSSRVLNRDDVVCRGLDAAAYREWQTLAGTVFYQRFTGDCRLVPSREIDPSQLVDLPEPCADFAAFLEHQRIPFISYPYEWCFGMLRDAALLHLELMEAALAEEMILKDASAFNIQWQGTQPVFIDVPSFVRRLPEEPWLAYRQFCQMFLYPLFLQAYKQVPFQPWLRGSLEGIAPEHCLGMMSLRDLFRPGVFLDVYLHARLQARHARRHKDVRAELRAAGFHKGMIQANVRRLQRLIRKLWWNPGRSEWSEYANSSTYSDADREQKAAFVQRVVASRHWNLVWDLGCNTGQVAELAAENAGYVVAMDRDQPVLERLYQRLKSNQQRPSFPWSWTLPMPLQTSAGAAGNARG